MSAYVNEDGWEVERGRLTRADPTDGGWEVEHEGGWGTFWLQAKQAKGIVPKVGDDSTWFMSNGSLVRGVEINGVRLFYSTRAQADRQARISRLRQDRKRQSELDKERPERDRRRTALPEPLRARLDRYEAANPLWRRDFESYELFTVEQAASLAALPKTGDLRHWYQRFEELSYERERAAWPGMSDQHSGNTFGATLQLAYFLDMGWRERIVNGHGAMAMLTGCAEYGCHTATPAPEEAPALAASDNEDAAS